MDNRLRAAFRNLKSSPDKQQLIKIYQEIRCLIKQNLFGASKQFERDLIVLCAEEAQKFELNDVANDCLDMFFKSAPPEDMWTCRAILCKVKLLSQNVLSIDDLHGISSWTIQFLSIVTNKPRLHTHGLDMCLLYLHASQPFMREGSYKHLMGTLKFFAKFFEVLDPADRGWEAIIHVHHINSLLDNELWEEADDFIVKNVSFITENAVDYKLHIMKLVVNRKLDKYLIEVIQSQTNLKFLHQICLYRSAIKKTELPFTLDDLFTDINDTEFSSDSDMFYLLIHLCMLCLEDKNLSLVQSCLSTLRDKDSCSMDEKMKATIEFLDIDYNLQNLELASGLLCRSSLEKRLSLLNMCANLLQSNSLPSLVQLGCIIAWNACKPLLQSIHRLKVKQYLTLIFDLLCSCKSHMHSVLCQVSFELSKCYHDDDDVTIAIHYLNKALENVEGKYVELLTMFHHRLTLSNELDREKFERLEDKAAQLLEHSRPIASCPPPLDQSIFKEVGSILAPLIFIEAFNTHFTWTDLYDGNDIESAMFEISCKLRQYEMWQENSKEYFKNFKDEPNDVERMMIWADLAKMSKDRNLWKICMIASTFCLVYDDGRWSLSLDSSPQLANLNNSSISKKWRLSHYRDNKSIMSSISQSLGTPTRVTQASLPLDRSISRPIQLTDYSRKVNFEIDMIKDDEEEMNNLFEKEILRTLGEVRQIRGEATLRLLKMDGVSLGMEEHARIPNMDCCPSNYNFAPEWISYVAFLKNMGKSAVDDFLRAGELGLKLGDGWMVESASAHLWNHHQEAVKRGYHDVIITNFLPMYDTIERFDGLLLPKLLVSFTAQISNSVISKYLKKKSVEKSTAGDPPNDSSISYSNPKHVPNKNISKNFDKKKKLNKTEIKDNPELQQALEICENTMTRINTNSTFFPSFQLDVSSCKPLLLAWIRCKHLLGQTVGSHLDHSVFLFPENLDEKCQNRIKSLIVVECLRFFPTSNFKDSLPSNSEILQVLISCEWIPKKKVIVATIAKDEFIRDLLLALELFTAFASRVIEGGNDEDIKVVDMAMEEAFKCSDLLLEGSSMNDEETCTKFNVLMSHAHLTRGRNLVAMVTTSKVHKPVDGGHDDDDDSYKNQTEALKHFVSCATYACKVKDTNLTWSCARRFCNLFVTGLFTSTHRRSEVKDCISEILRIMQGDHEFPTDNSSNVNHNAIKRSRSPKPPKERLNKKGQKEVEKVEKISQSELLSNDDDNDDDVLYQLNDLLYRIYIDDNQLESALRLSEHAYKNVKKLENKKKILRNVLFLRLSLSLGITSTIVKFKDEDEVYVQDLWMNIAREATNPTLQVLAYHAAIETIQTDKNDWLKFESILEFAQFLYCKGHDLQEVQDLVEWGTQIISFIASQEINATEFKRSREAKFKDELAREEKKLSKDLRSKSPKREKSPKKGKPKVETKDENSKNVGKTDPKEDEVIERTIKLDLLNRMSTVDVEKLENILHLEGLLRCYVVMAMTSEAGSTSQIRFSLICHNLIMRILKQLVKDRPMSSTSIGDIKSNEDGKKKQKMKKKRSGSQSPKQSDPREAYKFPKSLTDWSTFALPNSMIDSIKAVTAETSGRIFPKPNLTTWYLLEISKVFQHIMLTPLLFPCLVLVETISRAYMDCKSLVNYVHVRLLDASIELDLHDGVPFHGGLSSFQIEVDDLLVTYSDALKNETKHAKKCTTNNNNNNSNDSSHQGRHLVDLNDKVDLINIFIDFASVCNKFCLYKPTHRLLDHVIEISRSTNNNAALNRSYLELAKAYRDEKNFHAAYDVIDKLICSDDIDLQVWLSGILVAIETFRIDFSLNVETKNNKIKEMLSKNIDRVVSLPGRTSQYVHLMLKVERCKNEFNSIRPASSSSPPSSSSSLEDGLKIVEEMRVLSNDLRDMNKLVDSAQVLVDGGSYLYEMSKDESLLVHQAHDFMMRASSFYEKAESLLEEQLSLIYDCLQDLETEGCSLVLERMLSHLKMRRARLLLFMLETHIAEQMIDRCALRRRNSIDKLFQDLVPHVVECSGSEIEWNHFMGVIIDKIFVEISAAQQLCLNYVKAKSEISFLYGKLFYLLSQRSCYDLPSQWDVYMVNEQACSGPDITNWHRYDRYVRFFQQLKSSKSSSDAFLARSTEFLLHALLHSTPRQIELASEICHILVECFGRHDPHLSSLFLLYYQSCESTKHLKYLLSTCLQDASSSKVAALYNQMMNIHKDAFINNSLVGPLYAALDTSLREKLPAWKRLEVSKSHLQYLDHFDHHHLFVSLVHSPDKKHLYGALVRGSQPSDSNKQMMSSHEAMITKMSTSKDRMSCLKGRWKKYKGDLKEDLLRQEMRLYAHHIHQKKVSSDKNENIILEQEFFQVLDLVEGYLKPLVDELRFHLRKQSSSSSHEISSTPSQILIILADNQLLEFPLEGMSWLRGVDNVCSISRDVSMNMLHRRVHDEAGIGSTRGSKDQDAKKSRKRSPKSQPDLKMKNAKQNPSKEKSQKKAKIEGSEPLGDTFRVHASKFKYLIDPYNDAVLSVPTATEIIRTLQSEIGKSLTSQWKGYLGDDVPPSKGEVESLITMEGSGIYLTFDNFNNLFDLLKVSTTNLSECQLMLILDLCQSATSRNRQLKQVVDRKIQSISDNPVDMALLLSMSGVVCLLQNQWYSSPRENFQRFQQILKDLFITNYTVGEAMLLTLDPKLRLMRETSLNPTMVSSSMQTKKEKPHNKSKVDAKRSKSAEKTKSRTPTPNYASVFHKKEFILKRLMFNMVCYGLPNVIVATGK